MDNFVEKTEDSEIFRISHSPLCKQGWAFRDLRCSQRVTLIFREKHTEHNIQKIMKGYIQRITENYVWKIIENYQIIPFRLTFRVTFISFFCAKK